MHENLVQGYWVALWMIVACLIFISCVFAVMFILRLTRHLRRPKPKVQVVAKAGETKQQIVVPVMVMMTPPNVQVQGPSTTIGVKPNPTGLSSEPIGISYVTLATDPAAATSHQTGAQPAPRATAYARLATDPQATSTTVPNPVGILREPITYARLATEPNVNLYPSDGAHVTFSTDLTGATPYPTEKAENPTGIAHARLATDPTGAQQNSAIGFDPNTARVTGFVLL